MDPASLTAIGSLIGGVGTIASSFLGGAKPAKPAMPTPAQSPTPDAAPPASGKTSFLSNAAAATTPSQTSNKSLLGQ